MYFVQDFLCLFELADHLRAEIHHGTRGRWGRSMHVMSLYTKHMAAPSNVQNEMMKMMNKMMMMITFTSSSIPFPLFPQKKSCLNFFPKDSPSQKSVCKTPRFGTWSSLPKLDSAISKACSHVSKALARDKWNPMSSNTSFSTLVSKEGCFLKSLSPGVYTPLWYANRHTKTYSFHNAYL